MPGGAKLLPMLFRRSSMARRSASILASSASSVDRRCASKRSASKSAAGINHRIINQAFVGHSASFQEKYIEKAFPKWRWWYYFAPQGTSQIRISWLEVTKPRLPGFSAVWKPQGASCFEYVYQITLKLQEPSQFIYKILFWEISKSQTSKRLDIVRSMLRGGGGTS